jgi:hypothetical protein
MGVLPEPGAEQTPFLRYIALDIDAGRVSFLNQCLILMGLEPLARCQDALSHPPQDQADVTLLLKMSPTLERQEGGATLRLIDQLHSPHVVVSFAVRSLGGREKGMALRYQEQFTGWVRDRGWLARRLDLDTELVFVVQRQAGDTPVQGEI